MIGFVITHLAQYNKPLEIVHLSLTTHGKQLGTEDYEFKPVANNQREIKIVLHLTSNNLVLVAKSVYTLKGKWLSKSMDVTIGDRSAQASAVQTSDGAVVDAPSPTGRFKHTLQPPDGVSLDDPTVEWWRTVKPTIGTSVTFAYFDLEKLRWERTTFVYMKDKEVQIAGKTILAHEVKQSTGINVTDFYFDSVGDPVLINGTTRFEMTGKTTVNSTDSK